MVGLHFLPCRVSSRGIQTRLAIPNVSYPRPLAASHTSAHVSQNLSKMNTEQVITILANATISGVILILLKHFIPSYFAEKAKNLATKQDIGEITRTVESIKLNNNSQLEVLKTELTLLSRNQQIIYDDERKAIVEFVSSITQFYESNINLPIESNTQESFDYMQLRIRDLESDFRSVHIAHGNLKVFCFNDEILKTTYPILSQLIDIKTKTQVSRSKLLSSLRVSRIWEDTYHKDSSDENFQKFQDSLNEQIRIHEEFRELHQSFSVNYVKEYSSFIQICKNYLKTKKIKEEE